MTTHTLRFAVALAVLSTPTLAQLELSPVTPVEGTIGTVVTISGTGDFGQGKPTVTMDTDDGLKHPFQMKILSVVTANDVTTIEAQITQAIVDAFIIDVQGEGKGGESGQAPNKVEVVRPTIVGLSTGTAAVGEALVVTVANAGNKRVKFRIGGKKAKGKPIALSGDGVEATFAVRVPKSLPNGLWNVSVHNKIGDEANEVPVELTVTGSKKKLGKPAGTVTANGATYGAKGKSVSATHTGSSVSMALTSPGKKGLRKTLSLDIDFALGTDAVPVTYDQTEIQAGYSEKLPDGTALDSWDLSELPFTVTVSAASGGQLRVTFDGTLTSQQSGDTSVSGEVIIQPKPE